MITDDPPFFDETAYLDANPDVRAAVERGSFTSARQHYDLYGRHESRSGAGSRRHKLLGGLDLKRMTGVEIGPLTCPLVHKEDGPVLYVDHADTESLRAKYQYSGLDISQIVAVDAVWGANSLRDCLGADLTVDYVVNAHVVEHVPDLLTWLQEIHAILKPEGTLRMAIPDRRYTFDILRRESSLPDVLDAYIRRARVPTPRAVLDHFLHYVDVDARAAWEGRIEVTALQPKHTPEFALTVAEQLFRSGEYKDSHCWVFTPASFAALCAELASLGLLHFACERLHPTERGNIEFIVVMRPAKTVDDCVGSWRAALTTPG